jgi:hypothetical protein
MSSNLRFWRQGKVNEATMKDQAAVIEKGLRAQGRWATPLAWREDVPPARAGASSDSRILWWARDVARDAMSRVL